MLQCKWCEGVLVGEELESPHKVGDEVVCDECYDEWFLDNSFECPMCCDQFVDGEESRCFILFDADFGEPGVYRALSYPFYAQPAIGMPHMYEHAIRRIASVPRDASKEGPAPCQFICKDCLAGIQWGITAARAPVGAKGG